MKIIALALAAFAAFFSPSADAQVALQRGMDRVVLVMSACPDKVLALIKPEYHDRFRQAFASIGGGTFDACWAMASDTSVVIIYEDGETSELPMVDFKKYSPSV